MTRSQAASLRSYRPSGTNSIPTRAISSNQGFIITIKTTIFKLEREKKRGKYFLDDSSSKYMLYDQERLWTSRDEYWRLGLDNLEELYEPYGP